MNAHNNARVTSRRIATLVATAALTALSAAAWAGHNYDPAPVDVEIVSDSRRAFAQYPVESRGSDNVYRAYLEALPQENYSVRVSNRTAERLGLVIAVDGRNIISGAKSKLKSKERMYILGPYESATYSGWRTGGNRVNRFYFTEADDSYAAAFNDRSAMGVIAVAAFREKYASRHESDPQVFSDHDRNRKSRAAPSAKSGPYEEASPGTGYGNEHYSPSVRVHFEPEKRALGSTFLKYEWRSMLCRKGITTCHASNNRFWPRHYNYHRSDYAPPPPNHRPLRPTSRSTSRYRY